MRTIGLIGGMSWESSALYYDLINKAVRQQLGGYHSCKSLLYTVDFAEIEALQSAEDWPAMDQAMAKAAQQLEAGGAELIVLCTNTMHLCSPAIEAAINIPFLHIADATGKAIEKAGLNKIALLGTNFTMEKDFYKKRLKEVYGIETIVPEIGDRMKIHDIIYGELVHGIIKDESRAIYKEIINNLGVQGAEGLVLGCTEIPLLISQKDSNIPVFNTTAIHTEAAVNWALKN